MIDGGRRVKKAKTALALCVLIFAGVFSVLPVTFAFTPPTGWDSFVEVTLTETVGVARVNEPVDVFFEPTFGECSSVNEIRVIAPNQVTEVPSQVYDMVTDSGYITSCRVVFLANCPASSSVTYYIIYNNPGGEAPTYYGLRLYQLTDNIFVNVTQSGVDDIPYFHNYWNSCIALYSNGKRVCWPGGPPGQEFFPITIGSMWADYNGTGWFGANKSISVVNDGPVFVDLNYTEAGASDFWGYAWDYNVTTTSKIRIYYQPNLNPLVRFHKTFSIKTNLANYTVETPLYMDFKLANSTSKLIYKYFSWKNTTGHVNKVQTETMPYPGPRNIWSPTNPVGWWSFSEPRSDSADWPAANIGYIPTQCNGTISGADYGLRFSELTQDDDSHCSQWFKGTFNGVYGDTFETAGYIVTSGNPGDVNLDWIVDIVDIVIIALAFGSTPIDPNWNPHADIAAEYGLIDIVDIVLAAIHFGEEDSMQDMALELRNPLEKS